MMKHKFVLSIIVFSAIFLLFQSTHAWAFLSDTQSHQPPWTGTYAYSPWGGSSCTTGTLTFSPGVAGFPSAGGSYTDPVFGETVRRISSGYSSTWFHVSYSAKLVINADSTKALLYGPPNNFYVYNLSNGTQLRAITNTNWGGYPPFNENWQWHPTDSDKIVFLQGSSIKEYSYAKNSSVDIASRGSQLNNGGTGEFTDQSGRYYAVLANNQTELHFYDRTNNVWYTGGPTNLSGVDYLLIGPDGSGALVVGTATKWYPINHGTRTFGTPVTLMNKNPHGDIVKDSQGKTWFVCEASGISPTDPNCKGCAGSKIIKVDVTNGSNNTTLIDYGSNWDPEHHISCNINGANRDWIGISQVRTDICTDNPSSSWDPFKEEIFLVNVTSGAVRRLAHHRSRYTKGDGKQNYYLWPKISLSVDGSLGIFNSHMGQVLSVAGQYYIDSYTVTTGFSPGTIPPQDTVAPAIPLGLIGKPTNSQP